MHFWVKSYASVFRVKFFHNKPYRNRFCIALLSDEKNDGHSLRTSLVSFPVFQILSVKVISKSDFFILDLDICMR